jgi:hypothetical protein
MKRRSFMKKSTAAAIIAVTPMALTGLVNAEGGGGDTTNTETTSFTDTTGPNTGTTEFFTTTETTDFTATTFTNSSGSCHTGAHQESKFWCEYPVDDGNGGVTNLKIYKCTAQGSSNNVVTGYCNDQKTTTSANPPSACVGVNGAQPVCSMNPNYP